MKVIILGKTAVIFALNDNGKLPGLLKGKVFRHGLVFGLCRHLTILLAHFEKGVSFICRSRNIENAGS